MEPKRVARKGGGGGSRKKTAPLETGRQVAKLVQPEKTPRRAATGTAAARGQALAQAAGGWPPPPEGLRASEVQYWTAIMICRLPQQWARVDLEHAANLARCFADIETNRRRLYREGDLVGDKASPRLNPRHALIETLTRRSMALTRILQLHAVVTIGEKGEGAGAAKQEATAAAQTLGAGSSTKTPAMPGMFNPDDLLARPRLQ